MHEQPAMRVCLYCNESAGEGNRVQHLTDLIARAGHHVTHVMSPREAMPDACTREIDCLVAAGGDGTVAKAGRMLAGGDTPLAILPLGTANNIATALCVEEDPERAIAAWDRQQVVRIDVGVIEAADGDQYFIEGVGAGLVPAGINESQHRVRKESVPASEDRLAIARQVFLDALSGLQPRHYQLRIDGEQIEEEALLVEVLNITTVGPRLRLSREAHTADGLLSVIVAGPADREAIAAHLRAPWDDHASDAQLKSWRASRVEVTGWHEYHVDDAVQSANGGTVTIGIKPGFLPVLA